MSFRIFASGSRHFHYRRKNLIDSDDFEPLQVASTLMTMEPSADGVVSAFIDHKTPGIIDLMDTMATIEFLHTLNDAVCCLAMCSGANDGSISVQCTESSVIWADTSSYATYNFWPGDNPGAEFIHRIGPGLKETSMNNWGVLFVLSIVLAKYYDHIGQDATPRINISLRR